MAPGSVTVEPCRLCRASGVVEQFRERFGDEWAGERGTASMGEPWAVDALRAACLARLPLAYRWESVTCPECAGAGAVTVEHSPCRIF